MEVMMVNIKAFDSKAADKLCEHWPEISPLFSQICQNIDVILFIDDPLYPFDVEINNRRNDFSLVLKLNSDNIDAGLVQAALAFGGSQINTLKSAYILKAIIKIAVGRTHSLIRNNLHRTLCQEANEYSERLLSYFSTGSIKSLAFYNIHRDLQLTLQEPIRTGFQITAVKSAFNSLAIADNVWRIAVGSDIVSSYYQFMDAEMLDSFLKLNKAILNIQICPTKEAMDEIATGLAEIAMAATFTEVTALKMPGKVKNSKDLIRFKSEIEEIVKRKEKENG
jgi:hypothetical protein